jgi:Ca-activated chloride channel family protein
MLPPPDAVRIEELINYFDYDYPQPAGEHPFSITTELTTCPWNPSLQLALIGIQGEVIDMDEAPKSNLVFLLDVSGSMGSPDKLGLLKKGLALLIDQLREEDRIAIVVYAGAAGVVLESTSGDKKGPIKGVLNRLSAGGSTAGGAGIELAYKIAEENFIKGGNNRILLATDGDFNVGTSSQEALVKLIEEKRESGVFLSVLGFGNGNLQDYKMEQIADKGNGNYSYIDNILEAKKVLVSEMGGTLFTIAKDVKVQAEFNPAKVKAYRLIGYVNRALAAEDFNDDKKDAGELGAGHTVTVLYEIVPVGSEEKIKDIDKLKYQKEKAVDSLSDELLTVKFRYKKPEGKKSILMTKVMNEEVIELQNASHNLQFSAAVASFGMKLRGSESVKDMDFKDILEIAKMSKGLDENGYRAEFLKLVETAELIR